ncbi:MAG TPA: hypothetical protein DCX41_07855 [Aequorivita sp.]|nr:hypothetical protein [Pusillimonas sp.]HAV54825.1 hypothetical protein [Aequorivita sp.]|tara:strand:+ start:3535 stop:4026 length:492 start_codon:yes stop_codon:yes gene_type:complete
MLVLVKFLMFFSLAFIFFQDYRDRQVYIFLFPLFGILGSYLFFLSSSLEYYFFSVCMNLGIILIVVLLNYFFAELVLKMSLLKEAMGLGDILFFIAFAISFPTVTFINFFVFSILFTFVLHLALSKLLKKKNRNIPLAGYMSLFLMAIYSVSWFGFYDSLYLL